jgi:hypothetical protein
MFNIKIEMIDGTEYVGSHLGYWENDRNFYRLRVGSFKYYYIRISEIKTIYSDKDNYDNLGIL